MGPPDGFKVSWPILICFLICFGISFIETFLEQSSIPDPPDWLFGTKTKPPKKIKKRKNAKTSTKLIDEAVLFLCCLGEKKRNVVRVLKNLSAEKKYDKVEDLVKDFYKS